MALSLTDCDIICEYMDHRRKSIIRRNMRKQCVMSIKQTLTCENGTSIEVRVIEKYKSDIFFLKDPLVNYLTNAVIENSSIVIFCKEYLCNIVIKNRRKEEYESILELFTAGLNKVERKKSPVNDTPPDTGNENNPAVANLSPNSKHIAAKDSPPHKVISKCSRQRGSPPNNKNPNTPLSTSSPAIRFTPAKKRSKENIITPTKLFNKPSHSATNQPPIESASPPNKSSGSNKTLKKWFTLLSPPKNKQEQRDIASRIESPEKSVDETHSFSLTDEQQRVIDECLLGRNVFFSGGAGTGKSWLLSSVIKVLESKHGAGSVFVTATTGLAACAIGGITVHQFAGLGAINDDDDIEDIIKQVMQKQAICRRWRQAKCLIIDEISMLSPKLLEILKLLAERTRASNSPFGGLQVIFSGDFFQLPPVNKANTSFSTDNNIDLVNLYSQQPPHVNSELSVFTQTNRHINSKVGLAKAKFCFQTDAWKETIDTNVILTIAFRQRNNEFASCLESIRWGRSDMVPSFQKSVGRKLCCDDGILPTRIYTHRHDVDLINQRELSALPGAEQLYRSYDSGDENFVKMLKFNSPAKDLIKLKVGAQVILVKTIDHSVGLVNGTKGIVVRFTSDTKRPVVRFTGGIERSIGTDIFTIVMGGKVLARRSQLPLDLSWAISVHKSQGITVDKAIVDLQKVFECGQAYVALSRVRSIEGLSLVSPLLSKHIKVDHEVIDFYQSIK